MAVVRGQKEIAAYLDRSIPTVKAYLKNSALPVWRLNKRIVTTEEKLDEWKRKREGGDLVPREVGQYVEAMIPAIFEVFFEWVDGDGGVKAVLRAGRVPEIKISDLLALLRLQRLGGRGKLVTGEESRDAKETWDVFERKPN